MFSTQDLAHACRIFLAFAYPDGPATIPASKQVYGAIPPDASLDDFLPPAANASGICQDLSKTKAGVPGFEFRLGSASFPHLKLRIQNLELHQREVWVYSVDTHDRFHTAAQHLDLEEADAWRRLVEQNGAIKKQIESALAAAGFCTPHSLLKLDLTLPVPAPI